MNHHKKYLIFTLVLIHQLLWILCKLMYLHTIFTSNILKFLSVYNTTKSIPNSPIKNNSVIEPWETHLFFQPQRTLRVNLTHCNFWFYAILHILTMEARYNFFQPQRTLWVNLTHCNFWFYAILHILTVEARYKSLFGALAIVARVR